MAVESKLAQANVVIEVDFSKLDKDLRKARKRIESGLSKAGKGAGKVQVPAAASKNLAAVSKQAGAAGSAMSGAALGASKLSKAIGPLLGVAGVGLLAVKLKSLTRNAITTGDTIAKTADRVGLATGEYQRLAFAADLAGVNQGQFNSAMEGMVKRVGEARIGTGELVEKLKDMNPELLASVLAASSSEEIMLLVADAMSEISDATDKAALSASFFGRGAGSAMILMLDEGRRPIKAAGDELVRLGAVLSDDVLRGAEKANDALTTLSTVFSKRLTASVLGTASATGKLTDTLTDPATIRAIAELADAIGGLTRSLIGLAPSIGRVVRGWGELLGGFSQFRGELGKLRGDTNLAKLRTEITDTQIELAKIAKSAEEGILPEAGVQTSVIDLQNKLIDLRAQERTLLKELGRTAEAPAPAGAPTKSPTGAGIIGDRDFAAELEAATQLRIDAEREVTLINAAESTARVQNIVFEMEDALAAVKGNAAAREEVERAFAAKFVAIEAEIVSDSVAAQEELTEEQKRLSQERIAIEQRVADQLTIIEAPPAMRQAVANAIQLRVELERLDAIGASDQTKANLERIFELTSLDEARQKVADFRKEIASTFVGTLADDLKAGELGFESLANAAESALGRISAALLDTFLDKALGGQAGGGGGVFDNLLANVLGVDLGQAGAGGGTPDVPTVAGSIGGGSAFGGGAIAPITIAPGPLPIPIGPGPQPIRVFVAGGGSLESAVDGLAQAIPAGNLAVLGPEVTNVASQLVTLTGVNISGFQGVQNALGAAAVAAANASNDARLAALGSSIVTAIGAGGKALGGPIFAGETALVGERGPELFTAPRTGDIIPNDVLRDMRSRDAGGQVIQQTINVNINDVEDRDSFGRREDQALKLFARSLGRVSSRGS